MTSARTLSASCSPATITRSSISASWCRPRKFSRRRKAENVDAIGLSGLITPSLEEMCFVASEMEREGFDLPLLIGGATTSRVHTAVKIHPNYHRGQTVYVTDASRAVGTVQSLLSRDQRGAYIDKVRAEYQKVARCPCACRTRQGARVARAGTGERAQARFRQLYAAQAALYGHARLPHLRCRGTDPLYRLDALFPHLGVARAASRKSSTTRSRERLPASSMKTRRTC